MAGTENQPRTAASYPGSPRDTGHVRHRLGSCSGRKQRHDRISSITQHNQYAATSVRQRLHPVPALAPQDRRLCTRISSIRTGLIAGGVALTVVMIFIIKNAHS